MSLSDAEVTQCWNGNRWPGVSQLTTLTRIAAVEMTSPTVLRRNRRWSPRYTNVMSCSWRRLGLDGREVERGSRTTQDIVASYKYSRTSSLEADYRIPVIYRKRKSEKENPDAIKTLDSGEMTSRHTFKQVYRHRLVPDSNAWSARSSVMRQPGI